MPSRSACTEPVIPPHFPPGALQSSRRSQRLDFRRLAPTAQPLMGGKICHHSQRVVGPQATIQTAWAGGPASPAVPFVCPTTTPPLRPQMVAEHMQLVLSARCSSHTRLSSGPPLSADQSPEDWSRLSSCTPRHPTSRGAQDDQRGSAEQQSVALQQGEQQAAGAIVPISNLWRTDHAFAELVRLAVGPSPLAGSLVSASWMGWQTKLNKSKNPNPSS